MKVPLKVLIKILCSSLLISSCSSFKVNHIDIDKSLDQDVKIIQISDLHINKDKKIYRDLAKKINELNPDILFITGDAVDKKDKLYLLDTFLKGINSNISKYAILGNWEHWSNLDINELRNIYHKNNVKLLINESHEIIFNNSTIYIYGTDDYTAGKPNLNNSKISGSSINIVLTHSPGYFDYIVQHYPDANLLVFSGHTHGGQITFFGKPIFVPQGSGKYLKGIYTKENSKLYVSKGIGNSKVNFRLFAKPDIFEVTLK